MTAGFQYANGATPNLTRRTTNNGATSTFIVDTKNELTNAPSPYGKQIYDLNGNLRTNHGGNWVYQYDYDNRLIEFYRFDQFPNTLTQFFYDGLSRLRIRDEYHWEDPPEESPLGIEPDVV